MLPYIFRMSGEGITAFTSFIHSLQLSVSLMLLNVASMPVIPHIRSKGSHLGLICSRVAIESASSVAFLASGSTGFRSSPRYPYAMSIPHNTCASGVSSGCATMFSLSFFIYCLVPISFPYRFISPTLVLWYTPKSLSCGMPQNACLAVCHRTFVSRSCHSQSSPIPFSLASIAATPPSTLLSMLRGITGSCSDIRKSHQPFSPSSVQLTLSPS